MKYVDATTIATNHAFDGKEFVDSDTLFAAFGIKGETLLTVRAMFESCNMSSVEKRNETSLQSEIRNKCLRRQTALYSPIVTKDNWVYWVYGGHHRIMLEALAILYSDGQYDNDDFMLRHGLAWQITSMRPNTVHYGRKYEVTAEDMKIFELLRTEVVDY